MTSNIREVREELRRLRQEMKETEFASKEGLRTLNAYLSLLNSLGLSREHSRAISMLRAMMVQAQATYAVLVALQAVSGPLGWLQLAVGAGAGVISYGHAVEMGMRTR